MQERRGRLEEPTNLEREQQFEDQITQLPPLHFTYCL
jgi:hypothetical protein